jgi:hypothetical protein
MLEHFLLVRKCTQLLLSLPEKVALQALQSTLVVPKTAKLKQTRCRCRSGYAVSGKSGWLHPSQSSTATLGCSPSSIDIYGIGIISPSP